jgi:hypothetical protein
MRILQVRQWQVFRVPDDVFRLLVFCRSIPNSCIVVTNRHVFTDILRSASEGGPDRFQAVRILLFWLPFSRSPLPLCCLTFGI